MAVYFPIRIESEHDNHSINWENELGNNDVNIMLQTFMDRVTSAKEKYIPKSKPFPRKGTVPLCRKCNTVEAI